MKRIVTFLLCLFLVLPLYACATPSTAYTVDIGGKSYEINTEDGTIFDGTYTYEYEFSGDSSSYKVSISYPNGSTFYRSQEGTVGYGGWSDDYREELYVSGDVLCDVVATKVPKASDPKRVVAMILLFGLGVLDVIAPRISWNLTYGWRYKNAEPSDIALGLIRAGGVLVLIVGVVIIFS